MQTTSAHTLGSSVTFRPRGAATVVTGTISAIYGPAGEEYATVRHTGNSRFVSTVLLSELPSRLVFRTVAEAREHALDTDTCMIVGGSMLNSEHTHCNESATHLVTYRGRGADALKTCREHAIIEHHSHGADFDELA